ncbi:MAG TPA: serpin family protein [Polyangiaceae bacterium]|nr:serpin family protein [Polyangiaceae bacterium]
MKTSRFHPYATVALACSLAACGNASGGSEPVAASPSAGVVRAAPLPGAPVSSLAAGFNGAGFELLRTQPARDNLIFSPASIGHALLMARGAADDATGASLDAAFALPAGLAAHEAWNALDHALAAAAEDEAEVTITLADRIWPRLGVKPEQEWVDLLAREHGASSVPLDFAQDAEGSRETINDWVGQQTQGLIPELLPPGFIGGSTTLVLTDALYFKARWHSIFGKYGSVTDTFTHLDGSTENVELMRELELSDRRGRGEGFVGAEIPYAGRELSMLVIVPDSGQFETVRAALSQDWLDAVDGLFSPGPYELLLPKWTTKSQMDLLPWLQSIGAAPGSYPRITPDSYLAGAMHGADIAVDEWGTVAAAATGLGFDESGALQPELTIKADRPFFYFIRHRESGLVLFAGQVTDPS